MKAVLGALQISDSAQFCPPGWELAERPRSSELKQDRFCSRFSTLKERLETPESSLPLPDLPHPTHDCIFSITFALSSPAIAGQPGTLLSFTWRKRTCAFSGCLCLSSENVLHVFIVQSL